MFRYKNFILEPKFRLSARQIKFLSFVLAFLCVWGSLKAIILSSSNYLQSDTSQDFAKAKRSVDMEWFDTEINQACEGALKFHSLIDIKGLKNYHVSQSGQGSINLRTDGKFSYSPPADYLGYDYFWVEAEDQEGEIVEAEVGIFIHPSSQETKDKLKLHPRLILSAETVKEQNKLLKTDVLYQEFIEKTDLEVQEFLEARDESRFYYKELLSTAILYKLTAENKYLQVCIDYLEEFSSSAQHKWPREENSFLPLSYLAYSTALVYDWLYDELPTELRFSIEQLILKKIYPPILRWYQGKLSIQESNNIGIVDNASFGICALAFLDVEGKLGNLSAEILEGVWTKLQIPLRHLASDGSWVEGYEYWQFASQPLSLFMAALESSVDSDYGLGDLRGLEESMLYLTNLHGQSGIFNFADTDNNLLAMPQMLYFATRYKNPNLAKYPLYLYETEGSFSPLYLLFYQTEMQEAKWPKQTDSIYQTHAISTLRSTWEDSRGMYLAAKGFGGHLASHIDMDAGSFVFDALGYRWAEDSGNELYDLPGFWDYKNKRWQYYNKSAQGHNVLLINPSENPSLLQEPLSPAAISKSQLGHLASYTIIDLSERYKDVSHYERGFYLDKNNNSLFIQDELELETEANLFWQMHTKSAIQILEGGRSAILSQADKRLYLEIISPDTSAKFEIHDLRALEGTSLAEQQSYRHGVRKLLVQYKAQGQSQFTIYAQALNALEDLPISVEKQVGKMADWQIPDGPKAEKNSLATLDDIYIDGKALANFDPDITYYEVAIPINSSSLPEVSVESKFDSKISLASAVPGKSYIDIRGDEAKNIENNRYTIKYVWSANFLDPGEDNRLPISPQNIQVSAEPEATKGHIAEATVDLNLDSRWAAEGRQWIQYDLGQSEMLGAISLAYIMGDERVSYFELETSEDQKNWSKVIANGQSSGQSTLPELFYFPAHKARYLRLTVLGNELHQWNSLAEVQVYRDIPQRLQIEFPEAIRIGQALHVEAQFVDYLGKSMSVSDYSWELIEGGAVVKNELNHLIPQSEGMVKLQFKEAKYGLSTIIELQIEDEELLTETYYAYFPKQNEAQYTGQAAQRTALWQKMTWPLIALLGCMLILLLSFILLRKKAKK